MTLVNTDHKCTAQCNSPKWTPSPERRECAECDAHGSGRPAALPPASLPPSLTACLSAGSLSHTHSVYPSVCVRLSVPLTCPVSVSHTLSTYLCPPCLSASHTLSACLSVSPTSLSPCLQPVLQGKQPTCLCPLQGPRFSGVFLWNYAPTSQSLVTSLPPLSPPPSVSQSSLFSFSWDFGQGVDLILCHVYLEVLTVG